VLVDFFGSSMEVTELHGSRFELALELFRDNKVFTFRGVGVGLASDGVLELRVQSSWRVENTTEETALNDLEQAGTLIDALIEESASFASIVKGRQRRLVLIDDYGLGAKEFCHLVDGSLVWAKGMPKSKGAV